MKNIASLLFFLLVAITSSAQVAIGVDWSDTSYFYTGYKTGVRTERKNDVIYYYNYFKTVKFTRLDSSHTDTGATALVGIDNKGNLKRTSASGTSAPYVPTRSLSNGTTNQFTASTSKVTLASYTVNFAYSLTIGSCSGIVYLEYFNGTSWIAVSSASVTYTLVTLNGNQDQPLLGFIPPNNLCRIRIVANTNCTVTMTTRQEELNL